MITADLAAVLGKVRRPGDFFAAGTTELLAPLLEVERVGPVALPLLPIQARELIGVADPAPYGRGEQTVVDPAVRRCWQIGLDRVWAQDFSTPYGRSNHRRRDPTFDRSSFQADDRQRQSRGSVTAR